MRYTEVLAENRLRLTSLTQTREAEMASAVSGGAGGRGFSQTRMGTESPKRRLEEFSAQQKAEERGLRVM